MAQQYTAKRGSYSRNELSLLATSLGFPGSLLASRLYCRHTETDRVGGEAKEVVSEKMITELLLSGELFKTLEKVFNRYPAWYNVKSIRKAMQHIRHRTLSFGDVSECRVAFELYAEEDGSGMAAELSRVQLALKMLERVCSPSRLQLEIHRFSDVSDVPSRLQLYEFMDIVALCEKTAVEDERRLSELSLSGTLSGESGTSMSDLDDVADFDQILMTRDEKVKAFLEDDYQRSLHGKKKTTESSFPPPQAAGLLKDHIVHTDSRKSLVSLGGLQLRAVSPCLQQSQAQLHGSRCGFHTLSSDHHLLSAPASPPKSSLFLLPLKTPPLSHSRLSPVVKSHHSMSKLHNRPRIEDPLLIQQYERETHGHRPSKPIKVRLQHKPGSKHPKTPCPLVPKSDIGPTRVSEKLKEEISDICADSVVKAREMLQSSLSAIPPPHHHLSPDCADTSRVATNTSFHRQVTVAAMARREKTSRSGRMSTRFHLQPIVSQQEREDQQFLIDSLLWSSQRSKQHYQVIE